MDGDTVIAVAMLDKPLRDAVDLTEIGLAASDCLARAIARGIYEARIPAGWDGPPSYRDIHP
jgi:D-aminopeptidase